MENKLKSFAAELERFRDMTLATDFPADEA
jgi:hypothetical protein